MTDPLQAAEIAALRELTSGGGLSETSAQVLSTLFSDAALYPDVMAQVRAALAAQPSPSEPDVVLPCRNCGGELYDSITTRWDGKVPRCPRCAADQRHPIPAIEDQMREAGFLRSASPSEGPLDVERAILQTYVDHLPDGVCDLTGARHTDLVSRKAVRAAIGDDHA